MVGIEMQRRPVAAGATAVAITGFLLLAPAALGQSTDSAPVPTAVVPDRIGPLLPASATRLDYRVVQPSIAIALPSLDGVRPEIDREPEVPLRIGVPRPVPEAHRGDLLRDADWIRLADGTRVVSVALRSPDAGRVRAALQAELPVGAKVRFFAPVSPERSDYPAYSRQDFANRSADRLDAEPIEPTTMLWSPIVDGDTLGIEVELPAGAPRPMRDCASSGCRTSSPHRPSPQPAMPGPRQTRTVRLWTWPART